MKPRNIERISVDNLGSFLEGRSLITLLQNRTPLFLTLQGKVVAAFLDYGTWQTRRRDTAPAAQQVSLARLRDLGPEFLNDNRFQEALTEVTASGRPIAVLLALRTNYSPQLKATFLTRHEGLFGFDVSPEELPYKLADWYLRIFVDSLHLRVMEDHRIMAFILPPKLPGELNELETPQLVPFHVFFSDPLSFVQRVSDERAYFRIHLNNELILFDIAPI